jgi:hypothetical protein
MKEKFEKMGDMKSFFDLIESRGMVFITYVSLDYFHPEFSSW